MTALGRATAVARWIVGVGAATAVVMLFSLEGAPSEPLEGVQSDPAVPAVSGPDIPPPSGSDDVDQLIAAGQGIYGQRCASCHGNEGQGGQGPRLAGTVVVNYPDAAEMIDIVANGRQAMPSFSGTLSDEEIAAVVTFTRFGFP